MKLSSTVFFGVDVHPVIRIDKYLVDKVERATRSKIQRACADSLVRVNGKPVKANHKIKPNDKIEVTLPKPANSDHILPQDIPLDIRYEDDHLMVIYKPPGLVVHPGVGNQTGTLVNGLVYYLNKQKLTTILIVLIVY